MTPAVRCAIYARISLDATGEHLAVDRQLQDARRIAAERDWTVVAEYIDNSISASDARKNRPGYDAMVRAFHEGSWDALVCYDLDRLTRQPRQLEDWLDAAESRGLRLVTTNGEADLSTDGGRLFARIKLAVARAEVERKAARQRRAAVQRAELGKPPAGVRLTGYTTAGDTVPEEAAVVRAIFDRFAAGESLKGIAAWLTETGVPTRSGVPRWHPSSIRSILSNPRYAGRAVYGRQRENGHAGQWEAIIDPDTFDLVRALLADPRRRTQTGTDRKHLGSGLYLCGPCGDTVTGFSGGRYRCRSGCISRYGPPVDALVRELIRRRLARPDFADILADDTRADTREATAAIARLRARLVLIGADYDSGLIDGARYKVATEKVRAEIADAEATLVRATTGRAWALPAGGDPVAAFDGGTLMIQRSMVAGLLEVKLLPVPRGRKGFDRATVGLRWLPL